MIFRVMFKTPGAVRDDSENAAEELGARRFHDDPELKSEHRDDYKHAAWDELITFTKKWVKYGETITVEFDTEKGTAIVVPLS